MKKYLYDHGLPFNKKLAENLDNIKNRTLHRNKASLIIIDGGVGEGKTTLAVEISDYILGTKTRLKDQLAMGGKDFLGKLKICYDEKLITCIYDEAGDFDRRGALSRFNALLNRVFDTFRAFKIVIILCLPTFNVLDTSLFDKCIPRLLIHLHKRNNNYGNFRAYSLHRMNWLRSKMDKFKHNKNFAFEVVTSNFHGQFLDLTPDRSKELDDISTGGKFNILEQANISFENLIDFKEIGRRVNRSVIWVSKTTNKLRIKPDKVYKKRKYFHVSIVDRLMDVIDSKTRNVK